MPTDILDDRIRSLVTELIESAPPAPVLPQLEWGLERRPAPEPAPGPWSPPRRRPGRLRVLVSTVVILGALAAIATVVAVGPRPAPRTPLAHTHHLGPGR